MANTIRERTWQVELPDRWETERDDDCISIYHPDGVGALQISAATKDSLVTDDDLREFASDDLEAGVKTDTAACGDFVGFTFVRKTDDRFWRYWFLRCAQQMLVVTYNCSIESCGGEDDAINQIISTLRARTYRR